MSASIELTDDIGGIIGVSEKETIFVHHPEKYNPTQRFSARAKLYSKARPGYPQAALDYIMVHCHLDKGSKVADLGAGTGISARAFAEQGCQVTAVEPNDAMLNEAVAHDQYKKQITYVKATAENSTLPDQTYDAVVCAQAFHWFHPEQSLKDFDRILKPGGWVVLMWNERDESDAFTGEYGDLLRTLPDTSFVEVPRGTAGQALLNSDSFEEKGKSEFKNFQELDLDLFLGRAFSASYAPDPDSPDALVFEEKLRGVFDSFAADDDQVVMKYICTVCLLYTSDAADE